MEKTTQVKGFARIIWYGELCNGENGWITFGYASKTGFFLEVCKRGFDTGGLGYATMGEMIWIADLESVLNELPKRDSELPSEWDWERIIAHNIVTKYPIDRNSQSFKENIPSNYSDFVLLRFEGALEEWIRAAYKKGDRK